MRFDHGLPTMFNDFEHTYFIDRNSNHIPTDHWLKAKTEGSLPYEIVLLMSLSSARKIVQDDWGRRGHRGPWTCFIQDREEREGYIQPHHFAFSDSTDLLEFKMRYDGEFQRVEII